MKLSIIIPVFNGEKYVKECLDHIVCQSFQDYECILIDDGSTDLSAKIIEEYILPYNNFVLVKQNNSGVSVARNEGIKLSRGEYITFIDCDDYIEESTYKEIFSSIDQLNTDIVCFGMNRMLDGGVFLADVPFRHTNIINDYMQYPVYMHEYSGVRVHSVRI